MPSLRGATGWINSEPLDLAELRGRVVLVDFWTLTCINWLRTEPYVRAWSQAYRDDGLVVIGVHTPEFSFEHDVDRVRQATKERAIDYPVAVDNDYGIWSAFDNHYWPALYFVDADGIIRDHHFGEGRYEQSERVIQRLLGVERELVVRRGARRGGGGRLGSPAHARDVPRLRARRALRVTGRRRVRRAPRLRAPRAPALNHWALAGEWTIGRENVVLDQAGGSIAYRFQARDAHLVLSPGTRRADPRSACSLDGEAPARRTAWTSTRTATACSRRPPVPARPPARRGPRADPGDHLPRARRRGVRVHLRIAVADGAARVRMSPHAERPQCLLDAAVLFGEEIPEGIAGQQRVVPAVLDQLRLPLPRLPPDR